MSIIKWKTATTYAKGRNGLMQCKGVVLTQAVNGNTYIEPITSKGFVGNCSICIAKEAIDEVVRTLDGIDDISFIMPLPSPKPLQGFSMFIPENGYGVPSGYYNCQNLSALLRSVKNNPRAVLFVADMLA